MVGGDTGNNGLAAVQMEKNGRRQPRVPMGVGGGGGGDAAGGTAAPLATPPPLPPFGQARRVGGWVRGAPQQEWGPVTARGTRTGAATLRNLSRAAEGAVAPPAERGRRGAPSGGGSKTRRPSCARLSPPARGGGARCERGERARYRKLRWIPSLGIWGGGGGGGGRWCVGETLLVWAGGRHRGYIFGGHFRVLSQGHAGIQKCRGRRQGVDPEGVNLRPTAS